MTVCTSCSTALEPSARFCPECGTPAAPQAAPPSAPPGVPPQVERPPSADEAPPLSAAAPPEQDEAPAPAPPPVRPEYRYEPLAPAPPQPPTADPDPVVPRSRRRTKLVAASAVVALLVAGGGYLGAKALLGRGAGGADTPTAAVEALGSAVSEKDPLALLSLIAPAQVRSLADTYETAAEKSEDAGIVESDPFAGLDLGVEGLELSQSELGKDAAAVTVRSGSLTYRIDPDKVAPAFRDPDGEVEAGDVALADVDNDAVGFDAPIITLKQDGRWYVSPADTALEWWRRSQNYPAGDFSAEPGTTSGADSPEQVVTALTKVVENADVPGLLDLASPDELGAVYHYRSAIMAALQENGVAEQLRAEGNLTFDDVKTDVRDESDDSATVVITSLSGGATSGSDGSSGRFTFEDGCLRVSESGESAEAACGSRLLQEQGLPAQLAGGLEELAVEVVKVDDRWYLSPVRTIAGALQRAVEGLDSKGVLALVDAQRLAPAEKALTASPTTGRLEAEGDYAVFDFDAPAAGYFRLCLDAEAAGADVYGPDGDLTEYLTDDVYRTGQAGEHKVVVQGYEPTAYAVSVGLVTPKPARVGSTISGDVPAADAATCGADVYTIALQEGKPLFAEGTGSITVVDPEGAQYSDSSPIVPSTSGEHLIVAGAGSYSKQLKALPADAVVPGSGRAGTVTGAPVTYSLFGTSGQSVTVTVVPNGDFDPTLTLLSPGGDELAFDDDTNGPGSTVSYTFTANGLYRLRVAGYSGSTGSFVINVAS